MPEETKDVTLPAPAEDRFSVGDEVKFRGEKAIVRRVQPDGRLTVEWTEKHAATGQPGYFENVEASEVETA